MEPPVPELHGKALAAAGTLLDAGEVHLHSHDDADGLTSAAIAAEALEWAGVPVETTIRHDLDASAIDSLTAGSTVLFTDLGSGSLDAIADAPLRAVVADHHQPVGAGLEHHLNPRTVGLDGGRELSGAGTAYALAEAIVEAGELDRDPRQLAPLAVVGAVGDRQTVDGELVGANASIAAAGERAGVLAAETGLALYGTQTRPLPKLLEYASGVDIPGISGSYSGAVSFLEGLSADLRTEEGWPTWAELPAEARREVASALIRRAIDRGVPPERIDRLVGIQYVLTNEEPGTQLRTASEFATILNATARYDRSDIGLAVCRGDREDALAAAHDLLAEHRRNLSTGIELLRTVGTRSATNHQWFHAGSNIRPTIVGIVAGMALGDSGVDQRPIVAFAKKSPGSVKVSARAPTSYGDRGLDLGAVLREAAGRVGGEGGGHDMAAGATIPAGTEPTVIGIVDELIGAQLA